VNTKIFVRTATLNDVPALADLFNQYRLFYGQSHDLQLARQFLTDRFQNNESVIFVAVTENNALAGFAQLYPTFSSVSAKPAWILNDLFVDQAHRKYGVASALLERVLEHGKSTKAARVSLQTAHDNTAAQALYKKFGFVQDNYYLTFSNSL
jgi:ribosomal protein S18 acetylase RimI-like enzyme